MGLPRASGGKKRRWTGNEEDDGDVGAPATKVLCTSPPHALCAEDVLHHPALIHAHASTHALECELISPAATTDLILENDDDDEDEHNTSISSAGLTDEEDATRTEKEEPEPYSTNTSSADEDEDEEAENHDSGLTSQRQHRGFNDSDEDESMDEADDFIDDEEDKDSGFIDSNSIDNSSDDDGESRASDPTAPVGSASVTATSSSLQLSLSKVLPPSTETPLPVVSSQVTTIHTSAPSQPISILTTSSLLPPVTLLSSATVSTSSSLIVTHTSLPSSPPSTFLSATSTITASPTITTTSVTSASEERGPGGATMVNDGSVTTVTAAQTGTVVTSAYQGAVSSPTYEPHSYSYPVESYPPRPSTPAAWESCNYYDGSQQPTTNKYMEISPPKSGSSQSIQCDENGKSYLELGSASPYTHTFSSDCGNYTTSPSSYPSQTYNQTYTSPSSSYAQPNTYYNNSRQSYSPSPYNVYPANDSYGGFEGEGCSYGYGGNNYPAGRNGPPLTRGPPRCMSPFCDPTRVSPRPSCYHQQRLSVLNVSMYKLNRFRQFPDPSLHRSVLICNTLRHIERELEAEGVSVASILAHSHAAAAPHPHLQGAAPNAGTGPPPCPEPMPSAPPSSPTPSEGPLPPMHPPLVGSPLAAPVSPPPSTPVTLSGHYNTAGPTVQYPSAQYLPADHTPAYDGRETLHLRPYTTLPPTNEGPSTGNGSEPEAPTPPSSSPRPPPLPPEERTDAINWCSVLSLSSQTDLDSMNNNEYVDWGGGEGGGSEVEYGGRQEEGPPWKLPSLSAEDVLKSFPEGSKRLEATEDLDSIINVLVGS